MWQQSQTLCTRHREEAALPSFKDNAGYAIALQALYEAYLQHPSAAKKSARAALHMSQIFDVNITAVLALALAGDHGHATNVIDELATRRPEDLLTRFV